MTTSEQAMAVRAQHNCSQLIQNSPYAQLIGMEVINMGQQALFVLPPMESNIGNPSLPAIHGGCIAGFMENAARFHVMGSNAVGFDGGKCEPRLINFSLDYLRPGRFLNSYATCQIQRQGHKVVNVSVKAWQNKYHEPITRARV